MRVYPEHWKPSKASEDIRSTAPLLVSEAVSVFTQPMFLHNQIQQQTMDILEELCAQRRIDTERASSIRDFAAAFRGDGIHVIAELKKVSPSKGLIRENFDPAGLARELDASGAAALSVLAEPHRFLGGEDNVRIVRTASDLPMLFKDFVTTEFQVLRARACGADAVLLIAAAMDNARLEALLSCVRGYGMEALVETHTAKEIERAVEAGARIIGVNCRDLRTFCTDPSMTAGLIGRIPQGIVRIAESGIRTAADIRMLRDAGADGFLVGEALMREEHPGEKLKELMK